jgi:hypothetical protein
MTDRELLELAAKALGIGPVIRHDELLGLVIGPVSRLRYWNPLADDGDALRLAVILSLRVEPYTGVKMGVGGTFVANITDVYGLIYPHVKLSESHGLEPDAATRRAIVRAAAEIGRAMP